MVRVYLDHCVYSEIDFGAAGRVPPQDEAVLREALVAGRIIAPVSLANLDELLAGMVTNRPAAMRRLAIVRRLVGFHGMLKQPADILREAIQAYADGVPSPPVELPEDQRRIVVAPVVDVAAGSTRYDPLLVQVAEDVKDLKKSWAAATATVTRPNEIGDSFAEIQVTVGRAWPVRW